jgi:hypothetical protein
MKNTQAATQPIDPLAGLPADMRAVKAEFWAGLRPIGRRAKCPNCGAYCEMREASISSFLAVRYVLHCGDVQQVKA